MNPKRFNVVFVLVTVLVATTAAYGGLALARPFSDNMVLQRDLPAPVWGTADAEATITVTFAGQSKETTADKDGKWIVTLDPLKASDQPQDLKVSSSMGNGTLEIGNVLVGEVWIASGQSNMFLEVKSVQSKSRWHPFIGPLDLPNVRLLNLNRNGRWEPCTGRSARYFSAVGLFYARDLNRELGVPVGIISASTGGSFIEQWMPGTGGLYQGKILPLIPFALRGAIWYQGEANAIQQSGMKYVDLQKTMIAGWRKAWGQGDFPFYYVQIVPCTYYGYKPEQMPILWQAQRVCLQIPNTGMAVTTDLPSDGIGNIHPRNKWDVAHRLSLWALAKTYGMKNLSYSGPLYKSKDIKGDTIVLSFDCIGRGLTTRDGKDPNWFEIAGADGKFVKAEAVIDGKTVVVSSKDVPEPKEARFAWNRAAAWPNLINLNVVEFKDGKELTGVAFDRAIRKDDKIQRVCIVRGPGETEGTPYPCADVKRVHGGLPASPFSTEAKYNPEVK